MRTTYTISVTELASPPAARYQVAISDADALVSEHVVTVADDLLAEFDLPASELVHRSLAWLLTQEPPGAILPHFDLRDISTYFPEYPGVLTASE
jgi:hypothetical protein